MPDSTVHGFAADRFHSVRDAFEENLAGGADVGASCCVTLEGETVVDLWGATPTFLVSLVLSSFPSYLAPNHVTLVGVECSHCIVSVTPDAISAHAFDCALRRA